MTAPLSDIAPDAPGDTPAAVAGRSGSTFYWPMLLLPRSKRAAMFAIYAYCRHIDDIVDEPGDPKAKHQSLHAWRQEIRNLYAGGAPSSPMAAALKGAIERYGLPRAELEAVIDGMAMDLSGAMRAPDMNTLGVYCRRVAGAVGLLAIRVFDRADAHTEAFAIALGEALQLTNILRDLAEDAPLGRLYLPREVLMGAGIFSIDPADVLAHPNLPRACEALALRAETRFAEARLALSRCNRRRLWAAEAMMLLYRRLLERLKARGWSDLSRGVRIRKRECAWVTLRCAVGRAPSA
ncbi:presqualene diphosphate synthase HpnD [Azospirillum sp.]|uniref:presqualene diphosphate synthase HpnD n=1 Tax=Azospirillum sp. TaxID=34012 RepID=UPI003D74A453